jgi:hypothetical protein
LEKNIAFDHKEQLRLTTLQCWKAILYIQIEKSAEVVEALDFTIGVGNAKNQP